MTKIGSGGCQARVRMAAARLQAFGGFARAAAHWLQYGRRGNNEAVSPALRSRQLCVTRLQQAARR
ncbi:hypothetical protein ACUN0C_19240 [Faunimonas sp. B44]|uniref:hypothetical protein n=1 Tax=Faunimonas sp. B44 TaxID=3461493 RepID=UPI0040440FFF